MYILLKKLILKLPIFLKKEIIIFREWLWCSQGNNSIISVENQNLSTSTRINILVYSIHGLRNAGTEKNLQLIANSLADEFNIYYLYGDEPGVESRRSQLNDKITFIPFSYSRCDINPPHFIHEMEPNLPQVLQQYSIDLIITASPGYAHYPWNQIKNIPIILLNIFGSPTLQKNIKATIYNSQTTKNHAENWIGEDKQGYVMYAPLYNLPPKNVRELGKTLRSKLGIKETDFVFGRIGRADDSIFDPIGIRAWQSIVNDHPEAHLIVMSPAPALVKIVESENIPRVHLIPPSNREEDVWSLHGSLDVFAHFRYDGETSGVAIAESLTVGNPIITHQSKIWNAHLEYLTNEFARIANIDSISDYTRSMEEFINIRNNSPETWREMQTRSMEIAEENFSSDRYSHFINQLVRNILQIQNNL